MKHLLLAIALISLCHTAHAARVFADLSWWGNTGATPAPAADNGRPWLNPAGFCKPSPQPRPCSWWFPKTPAANDHDKQLWGNSGILFHCASSAAKKPSPEKPAPPPMPLMDGCHYPAHPVWSAILFDTGKALLKPEGKSELDKVIGELKQYPKDQIIIEGHTDIEGPEPYNIALGLKRAEAAAAYLTENGIDKTRITTKSYGSSKPAVPNDTPANRKLNRRVDWRTVIGN